MSSGEPMTDHTTRHSEPSAPSRGSVANHDAVPAAITVSDEARTDKAATSHRRDRSGNTPVVETLLLTCSEKAAIQFMLRHAAHAADESAFPDSADYRLHSEALYGLMERTAKWVTTQP